MSQITKHILMIQPVSFRFNEQTAVNNYYQKVLDGLSPEATQQQALAEFNSFVEKLRAKGVNVIVVEDTKEPDTPDSIFPNNWVSFHNDGDVGLYPMCAENRRTERREDIFDILVDDYGFHIEEIHDFTEFEEYDRYLEGTGSMILDRENKYCYAAISERTDEQAVIQFCDVFGYKPVCFTANQDVNGERLAIYHTNVMMCVADNFAVICLDTIDELEERTHIIEILEETNKEIIEISEDQKQHFAGNMLQLMGDKPYLVMSDSAYNSLTQEQISQIENHCPIIHSSLDTIEACGGGSARCMMAEIFLPQA
ncbi:MAG: arginine deiminase-related protein [Flavobacteriales bacterium]|nr:arginine deiminase-related protein [Flavobacteriales bacterium]